MENLLDKYIDSNKDISIDEDEWKSLNENYGKDFIKSQLIEEILAGNIRFPHRHFTIRDAAIAFKKLCDYKCRGFQTGDICTRYDYKYPLDNVYISETLVGNPASDFYHQNARSEASGHNDPSPQQVWRDGHYLNSSLKGIWTIKTNKKLNTEIIRSSMRLRKHWAAQFRPAMAKCIYELFGSRDVLDFSSGWGDRLCGFYACKDTKSYIGIDPNKYTYVNYFKQVELYRRINGEKKTTFYNLPAEDVHHRPNIVDTVFTSPPYFCAETYTKDPMQSWVRYSDIDSWLNGFMFKTLDNVWYALKPGGYLIINISDVYRKDGVQKICDPMNDYIKDRLGGTFVRCFGMMIAKRPANSAYNGKTGTSVEPVWVWRKPEDFILLPDGTEKKSDEPTEPTPIPEMDNPLEPTIFPHDPANDKIPSKRRGNYGGGNTKNAKQVEEKKSVSTDIIIDETDGIDPRELCKLVLGLKSKGVNPMVFHGKMNDDENDIILKLCAKLEIETCPLRNESGNVVGYCDGKRKLVRLQSDGKVEFGIIG